MQQNQQQFEYYSIDQFNDLIESIKRRESLTEEEIAKRLKYNEGYISQIRSRGKVSGKFVESLKREFNSGLQNAKPITGNEYTEQSLTNLTESNRILAEANRTLADANKTLAEANHVISKNHDELIQLTKMIVANSAAGQPLKPSPAGQHTEYEDDDRPAEDFLTPKGKVPSRKDYKVGSGHARGK